MAKATKAKAVKSTKAKAQKAPPLRIIAMKEEGRTATLRIQRTTPKKKVTKGKAAKKA